MKLTPSIRRAINRASVLHFHQKRRDEWPYIIHPFGVALILSQYTENEDTIIAGLLHDVLEDIPSDVYNYHDMVQEFGTRVAELVREVTEDRDPIEASDPQQLWEQRKAKYLENLKNDSPEALMIAAADKTHNMYSLMDAYAELGEELWSRFHASRDRIVWFFGEVLAIMQERLPSQLTQEMQQAYSEICKRFS